MDLTLRPQNTVMDASQYLQRVQAPLTCQLCENSLQIKWKCMDCNLLICNNCRYKIHTKIKDADFHRIVDIKEVGKYRYENVQDFSHINCEIHRDQLCRRYCEGCDEIVCPLCVSTSHQSHNFVDINEGYGICLKKLEAEKEYLVKERSKLTNDVSKLEIVKQNESILHDNASEMILKREAEMKRDIENAAMKLKNEIDMEWQILCKAIEKEKTKSETISKQLDDNKDIIESALKSKEPAKVFKTSKELAMRGTHFPQSIKIDFESKVSFVPGTLEEASIENAFGTLKNTEKITSHVSLQTDTVKEYHTELKIVSDVQWCEDGMLWLYDRYSHTLQYANLSNDSLQLKKSKVLFIHNMTIAPSGDLLVSAYNSMLQIFSQADDKLIPTKYDVSPLEAISVHVSKNGNIIIGVKEKGPFFPVRGPRQVFVLDNNGTHMQTHQFDKDNKPLFTLPNRITSDSLNNLYVIDSQSADLIGRVMILNKSGTVKGIFTGLRTYSRNPQFRLTAISTTRSDTTVVLDMSNALLHFLNTDGECVHYQSTTEMGIVEPFSLDINKEGTFVIGCSKKRGTEDSAKIYTVEISQF